MYGRTAGDHGGAPELVELFPGVPPRAFRRLVAHVARRGGRQVADGANGRQWPLPLADRVLLVATCYRTNLTMRQLVFEKIWIIDAEVGDGTYHRVPASLRDLLSGLDETWPRLHAERPHGQIPPGHEEPCSLGGAGFGRHASGRGGGI